MTDNNNQPTPLWRTRLNAEDGVYWKTHESEQDARDHCRRQTGRKATVGYSFHDAYGRDIGLHLLTADEYEAYVGDEYRFVQEA